MLKGICHILNPGLLSVLDRIGHCDEIILADTIEPLMEESSLKNTHIANPNVPSIQRTDRFDFHDRSKSTLAVLITEENI